MKQINDLLKRLGVVQYGGTAVNTSRDERDERFVTLVSGGLKEEGMPSSGALHEEEAVTFYMEQLQTWLAGRTVIIWRVRPEMQEEEIAVLGHKAVKIWRVYSRLTAYTPEQFSEIKS